VLFLQTFSPENPVFSEETLGATATRKNSKKSERILQQTKENLAQGALFIFFLTFMYFKITNDRQWMLCITSHVSDDHFSTN